MDRKLCPKCSFRLDTPVYISDASSVCFVLHPSPRGQGAAWVVYNFMEGRYSEWSARTGYTTIVGEDIDPLVYLYDTIERTYPTIADDKVDERQRHRLNEVDDFLGGD